MPEDKPQYVDGSVLFRGTFEHPSFGTVEFFYRPISAKEMVVARKDGLVGERSLEASVRLINRHVQKWNAVKPSGEAVSPRSESDVENMPVHIVNGVVDFVLAAGNEQAEAAAKNS